MAKLFVAVKPNSDCEEDVQRLLRRFFECPNESRDESTGRDIRYYMLDSSKYDGLVETLEGNLNGGKYSPMGKRIAINIEVQINKYGLYAACAMPNDYTLDEFMEVVW